MFLNNVLWIIGSLSIYNMTTLEHISTKYNNIPSIGINSSFYNDKGIFINNNITISTKSVNEILPASFGLQKVQDIFSRCIIRILQISVNILISQLIQKLFKIKYFIHNWQIASVLLTFLSISINFNSVYFRSALNKLTVCCLLFIEGFFGTLIYAIIDYK